MYNFFIVLKHNVLKKKKKKFWKQIGIDIYYFE